jgi:quinol monooxygenase YgiN
MQDEMYSIYHLALDPTKFPAFKPLIEKIVAATSKEADTLTYEYVANADYSQVHILERLSPSRCFAAR